MGMLCKDEMATALDLSLRGHPRSKITTQSPMSKPIDKNALRDMLAGAVEEKLKQDPDAITLYAPVAPITRRPWQSKATQSEQAYREELERIKQQAVQGETSPAKPQSIEDEFAAFAEQAKEYASRHKRHDRPSR
ncbi:hypothetical protein SAMN05216178_6945 [Pseudomonas saponiphila]|jgi:hypothetical protein|uniref:Uncharacterized protein n=1 Tax=Pseudomonas saponiphila TaxID=556534 RepID=A0A1H5A2F3_9PSED|nr:hypothetical protein [Pseudomonas saponiphila]SED36295.1 hypothetical protein SAMN05216178_6945 [Pseudomonas saponiphila]